MKFNVRNTSKTVNLGGGVAYQPNPKLELMLRTMSFLMSGDGYYDKEADVVARIAELVKQISVKDPKFVINLATYARNEMYLRTVPIYLIVEYAKVGTKMKGAYKYVPHILQRADEPSEAIAYYFKSSASHKVPAMLKKGIGNALNNFDEYQFGKYNREGSVSLKDVVFLTHPVAKNSSQQMIYDKIVEDKLAIPDTWETYISAHGSSKESWEHIIPKMGYMALLRNLRNFVKYGVDEKLYTPTITDPNKIHRAKQFPYRYYSAYNELEMSQAPEKVLDAVNDAMDLSVANVPKIPGKTAIFSDNSASMSARVSAKSSVSNIDIAALFSSISQHVCDDSVVGVFGQTYATVPTSKRSTILDNMRKIRDKDVGHSTEAWKAINHLRSNSISVDRIFIFSDEQCYNAGGCDSSRSLNSELTKYRKEMNPNCRMYSFDLAHYGLLQFPQGDPLTCPISGYSDTIFRFIPIFESERETQLMEIENYTIG